VEPEPEDTSEPTSDREEEHQHEVDVETASHNTSTAGTESEPEAEETSEPPATEEPGSATLLISSLKGSMESGSENADSQAFDGDEENLDHKFAAAKSEFIQLRNSTKTARRFSCTWI
jgi:hypothetical protein